ncbi:MAG: hypothetical protein LBK91_01820, partial [Synergistaceae bacterium]|nr:hypothetical protein [Synergistaceae bacterium]
RAESTGKIQIPTLTLNLISRSGGYSLQGAQTAQAYEIHTRQSAPGSQAGAPSPADTYAPQPQPALTPEQLQAQLANTLSVLGIDLSLLNTNLNVENK